jgi:hypothetical protein
MYQIYQMDLLKRLQASRLTLVLHGNQLSQDDPEESGWSGPVCSALIDASLSLLQRIERLQAEIADECRPWFWVRMHFDRDLDALTPIHPWHPDTAPWRPVLMASDL